MEKGYATIVFNQSSNKFDVVVKGTTVASYSQHDAAWYRREYENAKR